MLDGRKVVEDVRGKKESAGEEELSEQEPCVYILCEAAEELAGGMLHSHGVQSRGC